jgi:hypothetical protein
MIGSIVCREGFTVGDMGVLTIPDLIAALGLFAVGRWRAQASRSVQSSAAKQNRCQSLCGLWQVKRS